MSEKLPRKLQGSLGLRLFESSLVCLEGVIAANAAAVKEPEINGILTELEKISVYLKMLYDFKGISQGEYGVFSERLSEIAPQVVAWRKWDKSQARK